MKFQTRDAQILSAIFDIGDGLLARRQIQELFWPEATTDEAIKRRMRMLEKEGYVYQPSQEDRQTYGIREALVLLGWRGILKIAAHHGIELEQPASTGERQLRILQNNLRDHEIRWLREPRWNQTNHDITVIDIQLALRRSADELERYELVEWVKEHKFRLWKDEVEYAYRHTNNQIVRGKTQAEPDGFAHIVDCGRRAGGDPRHNARFLIEYDGGHKSRGKPAMIERKIAPLVYYILSPAYKARFSRNHGKLLLISEGNDRMQNLVSYTQERLGKYAQMVLFTSTQMLFDATNVLVSPIWWQVNNSEPIALLT